ncbi:helix-turn-helix domain-containing protein [Sorangium sp. So ce429]
MEETLDYRATAMVTGVPTGTLRALFCRQQIPHYRLGQRTVRFRPSEVEQWLQARHVAALRKPDKGDGAPIEERSGDAAPDVGGSR